MSLGFAKAGFKCLAAIDFDKAAVHAMRENFRKDSRVILEKDLTTFSPQELAEQIETTIVDVIIGGPPCQGFSTARQRDGANHGDRLIEDPRRSLYVEFLKYVAFFRPRVFVMENVLGIRTAVGGRYFAEIQTRARSHGYRVHGEEVRAWRFGVPQKRVRQLIIGTRDDLPIFASSLHLRETHALAGELDADQMAPAVSLWEAIGDLPPLSAGTGIHETVYDLGRREKHKLVYGSRYTQLVLEVSKANRLNAHVARPHNERDLSDFAILREGEHSAEAIARGAEMAFPYDRLNFKDRFTRQHRHRLCSTIVAHLAKDGLMFIHPTQERSLTPREAARIQSFPDWFALPVARTHSFKMIGNAVPPLVGKAVAEGISRYFASFAAQDSKAYASLIPRDEVQASERLQVLLEYSSGRELRATDSSSFKLAWFSAGYLFRRLHPDSAKHNGAHQFLNDGDTLPAMLRLRLGRTHALSGWPEGLVAIAHEARRRFDEGSLSPHEYYFSAAQLAGSRNKFQLAGT